MLFIVKNILFYHVAVVSAEELALVAVVATVVATVVIVMAVEESVVAAVVAAVAIVGGCNCCLL